MHITFPRIKKQYLKANIQPIPVVINFDFFSPLSAKQPYVAGFAIFDQLRTLRKNDCLYIHST